MTVRKDIERLAENEYEAEKDKAVPLSELAALIEVYGDRISPTVASELLWWASELAVDRVVDRKIDERDKVIWHFFEHGWHKDGCEGRLAQAAARIERVSSDAMDEAVKAMKVVESERTPEQEESLLEHWKKMYGRSDPNGVRRSVTTGRIHACPLDKDEYCYWSGDPYAPHEMGL